MRFRKSPAIALACASLLPLPSFAQSSVEPAAGDSSSSIGLVRSSASLSSQANQLNQSQWVRITEEGSIRGSVTASVGTQSVKQANVQVTLVQEGVAVFQGLTDVEGDFIIDNAKPGAYSLVASGENQLAVCSLTVLDANSGSHLPDRANIRSLNPATQRVSELIRGNTMPTWTVGRDMVTDPIADIRKSQGSTDVRIDSRGGVSGTLGRANASVDLSTTLVYLVRDGKEIARTRAASNGDYRFEVVAPGAYGLVASGPEGIAALGFTAIASDLATGNRKIQSLVRTAVEDSKDNPIPVPATAQDKLNVELAEPNCYVPAEVIPIEECVVCEETPVCPTMCGGWGGAGMGGGGGGGGIGASGGLGSGGLGGIGTLAALGALTAVAISQANDDGDQAPIVSPIK
jgi:hypothetical protein